MSNAKKILEGAKEKRQRAPRKSKVKVKNVHLLRDVLTDDSLNEGVGVETRILFERMNGEDVETHVGVITKIDESKRLVSVWDETIEQWWGFNYGPEAKRLFIKIM